METSDSNTNSAVVLFSGGQDSTTCLYWAKKKFTQVYGVGFDYGQMHRIELTQAQKIASAIDVPYQIFDLTGLMGASSLTEKSDHNAQSKINPELPASFTAGRNLLFLTVAASFAATLPAHDLVAGVCQTDYSGYPDCRRNTMDAMQLSLSLGLGIGDIRIHTPLMYLTKAETWKMANELGCLDTIVHDTVTDYNGSMIKQEWGYGELNNPASVLRAKGYFEAKQKGWI